MHSWQQAATLYPALCLFLSSPPIVLCFDLPESVREAIQQADELKQSISSEHKQYRRENKELNIDAEALQARLERNAARLRQLEKDQEQILAKQHARTSREEEL
eukprot:TRINITY_DN24381_c0_g1_i1.p1 TRINITY_DN24381_c0_g1~~TRINITY_DN24381_c0_g1_i1.p1  ORF type:complete len:104 (+),score=12.41 TRINITY_DN24381_c0_g1_i1:15-326(+)